MEWEFTPQQVVKGEASYGLADFRRDLLEEIRINIPGADEQALDSLFRLVYDMHYWLATGNAYRGFEQDFHDRPELVTLLRAVHSQSAANVEMLGAILQRSIMDGVEAGAGLEQALGYAADVHRAVVERGPLPATRADSLDAGSTCAPCGKRAGDLKQHDAESVRFT